MSKKLFISTVTAMATAGALLSSPIFAQSTQTMAPIIVAANQTEAPELKGGKTPKAELPARAEWMTLKQAYDALEKAGYKDIRSIHSSRYGYIAQVFDTEEKRIRLLVHPTDGTVTIQENRRRDERRKHHRDDRDKNCNDNNS